MIRLPTGPWQMPGMHKAKVLLHELIEEDNAMVYEEIRAAVMMATMAILSLSLALISVYLSGWWA